MIGALLGPTLIAEADKALSNDLLGGTGPGHLDIAHDVAINGVQGSHRYDLTVTALDSVAAVTLTFQGTTTAYTPAGPLTQPFTTTEQVTFGGTCPN